METKADQFEPLGGVILFGFLVEFPEGLLFRGVTICVRGFDSRWGGKSTSRCILKCRNS